ncbi:MAG: hypothetical protein J6W28_07515 [Clostridia bacterium]|nr:hypothetical protein [Clostridia bacterium]
MKGLLLALLLFLLLSGLLLADALFVEHTVSAMEQTLFSVSADEEGARKVSELKQMIERHRFLLSISLPLAFIDEAEEKLVSLTLAVGKGLEKETQKEKEALSLCFAKMRKGALPTLDVLL